MWLGTATLARCYRSYTHHPMRVGQTATLKTNIHVGGGRGLNTDPVYDGPLAGGLLYLYSYRPKHRSLLKTRYPTNTTELKTELRMKIVTFTNTYRNIFCRKCNSIEAHRMIFLPISEHVTYLMVIIHNITLPH